MPHFCGFWLVQYGIQRIGPQLQLLSYELGSVQVSEKVSPSPMSCASTWHNASGWHPMLDHYHFTPFMV